MVARPRAITVERGSRGFGLSLIYRGLDKYEEKDTGIFVARVVPGGQAARYGVRENDKILTINAKTPRNVDDAVGVIKQAGAQIKLVVLREEDGPDITIDEAGSVASGQMGDSSWVSEVNGLEMKLDWSTTLAMHFDNSCNFESHLFFKYIFVWSVLYTSIDFIRGHS